MKNRTNYFEVQCYEGKVRVSVNGAETILTAGNSFRIANGVVTKPATTLLFPSWIKNKSSFKSVPLAEVLAEFERQYNVTIETQVDTTLLFSGAFVHDNKKVALQSISIPFNLEYTIVDNKITLTKIEE